MIHKRCLPYCWLLSAAWGTGAQALPASLSPQTILVDTDGAFIIHAGHQPGPADVAKPAPMALRDLRQLGSSIHIDRDLLRTVELETGASR